MKHESRTTSPMVLPIETVGWYALRVRGRFERLAARSLKAKGYEEYLPFHNVASRWADHVKSLEVPLFPGYMFCRFDCRYRLPILVTPGVLSVVGIGGYPALIKDSVIGSIKQAVASGLPCESLSSIPLGEPVLINRGPLAGLSGTLVRLSSNLRLILALPMLQRSLSVEIDSDCVEQVRTATPVVRSVSHRLL